MKRHVRTVRETVTVQRPCPECGHIHPNGIGLAFCLCDVCPLPHTPYEHLAPYFQALYDATWGKAT